MLTIKTRPYLAAEEIAVSTVPAPGAKPYYTGPMFTLYRKKDMLAVLLFIFFLLVPFFIIKSIFQISGRGEVVLLIALIAVGFCFILWKIARRMRYRRDKIDPGTDQAEVIHVNTRRAIQKENPFGPGMAFYIDVLVNDERKSLYLFGHRLEQLHLDRKFPNTEFEIVRSLKTKQIIRFLVLGNYFPAEGSLPPFRKEELEQEEDVCILDMAIEDIK